MPFIFLVIGLILIIAGARNRGAQLSALLVNDFSGQNNFLYWLAGIGAIGAVGYYAPMKNASRLFLFLLILSMLLSNKGFFAKLQEAIANIQPSTPSSEADVGAATTDSGATVTGGASDGGINTPVGTPTTTEELLKQYPNGTIPPNTPLPTDFNLPLGAAGQNIQTIGALQAWLKSLPATSTTGPSQENPNIAPAQENSAANNALNGQAQSWLGVGLEGFNIMQGIATGGTDILGGIMSGISLLGGLL